MMDWIEVNGASLRYDLGGSGEETLILIHELGGSLESFDEVLPEFQKHFRVLRYDQRGFGQSEKTKTLSLDGIVTDLACLLDALGIGSSCHIASTALGAGIALAFAIAHPEKVKRLAVASPSSLPASQAAIEERIKLIEAGGMRASVDASLQRSYPDILRKNEKRYNRYRNRWLANDPEGFIAVNRVVASLNIRPELNRITCPTLVIGCTLDIIYPPETTREVADLIPSATYIEVETGHFMAVQTPELFVKYILSFLKEG
jgi:3-oxoadipate enol-lactonase